MSNFAEIAKPHETTNHTDINDYFVILLLQQ